MTHEWKSASGLDVIHILAMARAHFETEIDKIFEPDPVAYSRNITLGIVNQFYNPGTELIKVAKDTESGCIVAYVWAKRGVRSPWSDQEMIMVQMAHVDLNQSTRARVKLIKDMIEIWEQWGQDHDIPIVCSTTMRNDQQGFLELHRRMGYDVRGSYCYKNIKEQK